MMIFGERERGETYRQREGAYCVLFDREGKVALVDVSGRLLLPGGGIEPGEDPETALRREFQEETGIVPEAVHPMCRTGEYMRSLDGLRCEFVIADLFYAKEHRIAGAPIEADHALVWMDAGAAARELFRPGQRWDVEEALRRLSA